MKRPPREAFAVFAILLIVFYLAGGAGGIKEVRTRISRWLAPPTAEQVQAAAPTPAPTTAAVPLRQAVGRKLWLADPPSRFAMGGALVVIITSAFLAMYFTGRAERR